MSPSENIRNNITTKENKDSVQKPEQPLVRQYFDEDEEDLALQEESSQNNPQDSAKLNDTSKKTDEDEKDSALQKESLQNNHLDPKELVDYITQEVNKIAIKKNKDQVSQKLIYAITNTLTDISPYLTVKKINTFLSITLSGIRIKVLTNEAGGISNKNYDFAKDIDSALSMVFNKDLNLYKTNSDRSNIIFNFYCILKHDNIGIKEFFLGEDSSKLEKALDEEYLYQAFSTAGNLKNYAFIVSYYKNKDYQKHIIESLSIPDDDKKNLLENLPLPNADKIKLIENLLLSEDDKNKLLEKLLLPDADKELIKSLSLPEDYKIKLMENLLLPNADKKKLIEELPLPKDKKKELKDNLLLLSDNKNLIENLLLPENKTIVEVLYKKLKGKNGFKLPLSTIIEEKEFFQKESFSKEMERTQFIILFNNFRNYTHTLSQNKPTGRSKKAVISRVISDLERTVDEYYKKETYTEADKQEFAAKLNDTVNKHLIDNPYFEESRSVFIELGYALINAMMAILLIAPIKKQLTGTYFLNAANKEEDYKIKKFSEDLKTLVNDVSFVPTPKMRNNS